MRIRFDTHVLQLFLSDLFKYVGGELEFFQCILP